MKNAEVLKEFDMIVSVTEKTLNDQFTNLMEKGIIHSKLIIVQELNDSGEGTFKIYDSAEDIPLAVNGDPAYATIDVNIQTQVAISHNNKIITFILKFLEGEAWFWVGRPPKAKLIKYDATGWQYAVEVNIDLAQLQKDSIWTKIIKVPDSVKVRLNELLENMFDVNYLFMDFKSSDLRRFIPEKTETGLTKDHMDQWGLFMNFYMNQFYETGNPFILAYSIIQSDQTMMPAEARVPSYFKPTGTTYAMFRDRVNEDFSTLSFAMVTKGGHGSVKRSLDGFDDNWISPEDGCDAKISYAAPCFTEAFIIKPLYEKLCNEIYDNLKSVLTLGPKKTYDEAKKATNTGYKFTIADSNIRSDIYNNSFEVSINNLDGEINYDVKGNLFVYKGQTFDLGVCLARASAEAAVEWSAKFIVRLARDMDGKPKLVFEQTHQIDKCTATTDTNTCAELWDAIEEVLAHLSTTFTFLNFTHINLMFGDIFQNIYESGNINSVLSNLDNSFNNAFMLPAGGVFLVDYPASDIQGNVSVPLKYNQEMITRDSGIL